MRSGGHRPFVQPERESAGEAFFIGLIMKTCNRCGIDFDGVRCKSCSAKYNAEYKKKNKESISKYGREYYVANKEKINKAIELSKSKNPEKYSEIKKIWTEKNRDKVNANYKRWGDNNKNQQRANNAVNNAVRDGRLIKPAICSMCGCKKKLHAHHEDYSKMLDVIWLCIKCHHARHKAIRQELMNNDRKL